MMLPTVGVLGAEGVDAQPELPRGIKRKRHLLQHKLHKPYTIHGFRSSFRDWGSETTHHQNEVLEMALAHTIPNKVEAAYRRGELLEKRRALSDDWGKYLA